MCPGKTMGMKSLILLATLSAVIPVGALANEAQEPDAGPSGVDQIAEKKEAEPAASPREIDELKKKLEEMEERLDSMEEEHLADIENEIQQNKRTLDVYGFFDFSFNKAFIEEDNYVKGILVDTWSFMVSHLNLYLASQLTETLSALVELRFTFAPNGYETSLLPYERVDTTIVDSFNTEKYRLGGVLIERVQLTWQPYDFFGITAGRFLTPFGIWNVDHGSPVLITGSPPYMMILQTVPLAQTGIQVHGRFFPFEKSYIDYAFTVSNGRGPMDEVYDIDDNKALGLRLRFERDGRNVDFALGGYGYWGETSDVTKNVSTDLSTGGFIDTEVTERYDELAGALDFVLEMFGVRLQGEYARSLRKYEIRPLLTLPIVNITAPDKYQPDYIQWNVYGLLAWQLPLEALLGDMTLTPYVLHEYSVQDDSEHDYDTKVTRFGINYKPIVFVAIKLETTYVKPVDSVYMNPWWIVGAQLAVTF